MSNIGSVNGPNVVYSPMAAGIGSGDYASLSPDALLAYCNTQLQGIDTQVNSYMSQQNTQLAEKQAVQAASQAVANFAAGDPTNKDSFNAMANQMQAAINSLPAGDPVAGKLQNQLWAMGDDAHMATNTPGNTSVPFTCTVMQGLSYAAPSASGIQGYQTTISGFSDAITSEQSIGMIQIQSLVSARQTVVQLTTNMMATMDQTQQQIAGKIGS